MSDPPHTVVPARFVGVDVQVTRGCPYAVLDAEGALRESGWLASGEGTAAGLRDLVRRLRRRGPVYVGIDAPRRPLPRPREHGFRSGRWGTATGRGLGRHCEVVVRSLGLANPQWTPLLDDAPPWMRLGFALFASAEDGGADGVHEVFPTVTYRSLERPLPVQIDLASVAPGPKDMLDAVAAAATVMAFIGGDGCEVGGGDGLGTILVPRALTEREAASPVHEWPGESAAGGRRGR